MTTSNCLPISQCIQLNCVVHTMSLWFTCTCICRFFHYVFHYVFHVCLSIKLSFRPPSIHLFIPPSVYLSVCVSVCGCLSIWQSVFMSVSVRVWVHLSASATKPGCVFVSVCLSVLLHVCVCVCLLTEHVLQLQMTNRHVYFHLQSLSYILHSPE